MLWIRPSLPEGRDLKVWWSLSILSSLWMWDVRKVDNSFCFLKYCFWRFIVWRGEILRKSIKVRYYTVNIYPLQVFEDVLQNSYTWSKEKDLSFIQWTEHPSRTRWVFYTIPSYLKCWGLDFNLYYLSRQFAIFSVLSTISTSKMTKYVFILQG